MFLPRLRELRLYFQFGEYYIAAILGISTETYHLYENGFQPLPIHLIGPLSTFYAVSADYLLGLTDIKALYPRTKPPLPHRPKKKTPL